MNEKERTLSTSAKLRQGSNTQNVYNIHHVLSNVKLHKNWGEIYYNPHLTGGYSVIFDTLDGIHTCFGDSKKAFSLNQFENISIDKITILLCAPAIGKPSTLSWWKMFDAMIDWGYPEIVGAPLYKNSVKWCYDYFIQWECIQSKIETIRIEFNPNKANLKVLPAFFSVFKSHSLQCARVSRIDIAIDYGIYLNPLCWRANNVSYSSRFEYNSILKTRYFGSSSSDVQLRIYDKAFELKCHGAGDSIDIEDFWRVEAQVKAIKGDNFLLLDDSICSFNPFERLGFYDPYCFNYEGQGVFTLFVITALERGVYYAAAQLGHHNTRKKYLDKLTECMGKQGFNMPSSIYENVFGKVYKRFTDELQELFNLGQKLGKDVLKEIQPV